MSFLEQSLESHVDEWACYFLTAAISLVAFSSIIYNYYLGENALTVFTDSHIARHVLHDFTGQLKQEIEHPVFDPAKFSDLDIDPTAWDEN